MRWWERYSWLYEMMRKIQLTIWDWDDEKDTADYMRLRWWERYSWLYEMMRKIQLTVWDDEKDTVALMMRLLFIVISYGWENATLYHLFWHFAISMQMSSASTPWWLVVHVSHTRLLFMFHCRPAGWEHESTLLSCLSKKSVWVNSAFQLRASSQIQNKWKVELILRASWVHSLAQK